MSSSLHRKSGQHGARNRGPSARQRAFQPDQIKEGQEFGQTAVVTFAEEDEGELEIPLEFSDQESAERQTRIPISRSDVSLSYTGSRGVPPRRPSQQSSRASDPTDEILQRERRLRRDSRTLGDDPQPQLRRGHRSQEDHVSLEGHCSREDPRSRKGHRSQEQLSSQDDPIQGRKFSGSDRPEGDYSNDHQARGHDHRRRQTDADQVDSAVQPTGQVEELTEAMSDAEILRRLRQGSRSLDQSLDVQTRSSHRGQGRQGQCYPDQPDKPSYQRSRSYADLQRGTSLQTSGSSDPKEGIPLQGLAGSGGPDNAEAFVTGLRSLMGDLLVSGYLRNIRSGDPEIVRRGLTELAHDPIRPEVRNLLNIILGESRRTSASGYGGRPARIDSASSLTLPAAGRSAFAQSRGATPFRVATARAASGSVVPRVGSTGLGTRSSGSTWQGRSSGSTHQSSSGSRRDPPPPQ